MSTTTYVSFTPGGKEYAYLSGSLSPLPRELVLVQVGGSSSLKLVRVVRVDDVEDPLANKYIVGIVQPQEEGDVINVAD